MKKAASILVLIVFLFTTKGFTISKHYCKGELVSIALNTNPDSCCETNACGCCHDESEFVQLQDNFNITQVSSTHQLIHFEVISFNLDIAFVDEDINKTTYSNLIAEPPFEDRRFLYYIRQFKLAPPVC